MAPRKCNARADLARGGPVDRTGSCSSPGTLVCSKWGGGMPLELSTATVAAGALASAGVVGGQCVTRRARASPGRAQGEPDTHFLSLGSGSSADKVDHAGQAEAWR